MHLHDILLLPHNYMQQMHHQMKRRIILQTAIKPITVIPTIITVEKIIAVKITMITSVKVKAKAKLFLLPNFPNRKTLLFIAELPIRLGMMRVILKANTFSQPPTSLWDLISFVKIAQAL